MIGIVFSRDRAMQLDGTLRSFFRHCQDAEAIQLVVLFWATTPRYLEQYAQLVELYPQVRFVKETNFRQDFLTVLLAGSKQSPVSAYHRLLVRGGRWAARLLPGLPPSDMDHFVLFLVDDNIVTRDFSLHRGLVALESTPDALGFSLRLGKNTAYSYMTDETQVVPPLESVDGDIKRFNWSTAAGDFNYPLELSSSIYRLRDILPVVLRLGFRAPNSLENSLAIFASKLRDRFPQLLCFETSVTFCAPINVVQVEWVNRGGKNSDYSHDKLADLFDEGYRIAVQNFDDFVPVACHQEVELSYVKPTLAE